MSPAMHVGLDDSSRDDSARDDDDNNDDDFKFADENSNCSATRDLHSIQRIEAMERVHFLSNLALSETYRACESKEFLRLERRPHSSESHPFCSASVEIEIKLDPKRNGNVRTICFSQTPSAREKNASTALLRLFHITSVCQ